MVITISYSVHSMCVYLLERMRMCVCKNVYIDVDLLLFPRKYMRLRNVYVKWITWIIAIKANAGYVFHDFWSFNLISNAPTHSFSHLLTYFFWGEKCQQIYFQPNSAVHEHPM